MKLNGVQAQWTKIQDRRNESIMFFSREISRFIRFNEFARNIPDNCFIIPWPIDPSLEMHSLNVDTKIDKENKITDYVCTNNVYQTVYHLYPSNTNIICILVHICSQRLS